MRLKSIQARRRAFTMAEIAICLGIIVFALVAILGVLPIGLNVQRANREDTVANQDGTFLMNALRSSVGTTNELWPSFYALDLVEHKGGASYRVKNIDPTLRDTDRKLIGLLSEPFKNDSFFEAHVRSFSGSAFEKGDDKNRRTPITFDYLMRLSIHPATNFSSDLFFLHSEPYLNVQESAYRTNQHVALASNLFEIRMSLLYPYFPPGDPYAPLSSGKIGSGRQSFRTILAASPIATNEGKIGRAHV